MVPAETKSLISRAKQLYADSLQATLGLALPIVGSLLLWEPPQPMNSPHARRRMGRIWRDAVRMTRVSPGQVWLERVASERG